MPTHTRSASSADIVRQGKRLSLQFPIQPTIGNGSPMFSPRSRPQSWMAAPSPVPSPEVTSSTELNILAVIAAQERYVLELKEELAQAERDLKMLKGYHASQESMRQLNESRKVTQLKPLDTALANFTPVADDEDGSSSWMMKEMERRKALLSATKSSQRKVFSGSRHLRTLSLLSPDTTYTPSFPQPHDLHEQTPSGAMRPPPLARSSTTPDIANQIATNVNGEKYDIGGLTNMQRDALLRTGKRMATDFKDGLLTFIEDIRQATVGEEAMGDDGVGPSGKGPAAKGMRKPSDGRPALQRSNTSAKKSSTPKTEDIGDDFWRQHGLSEPKTSTAQKKTHASKLTSTPQKQPASAADDFENWDTWDTPNDKNAHAASAEYAQHSSDESDAPSSPVSHQASSRTSTSSAGLPEDMLPRDSKRNSIPWPDLVKLSPTNLKRTASHLMKEWEKNLTPPPESRDASHASGDYIGRTVSPE